MPPGAVFLARGYHAATVEEIADEAGFSRGVVYSRFGTKAGLLLALLDRRIDELAEQNAALAGGLSGDRGAVALAAPAAALAGALRRAGLRSTPGSPTPFHPGGCWPARLKPPSVTPTRRLAVFPPLMRP